MAKRRRPTNSVRIDDVPWMYQEHRLFPARYTPERLADEEATLQDYLDGYFTYVFRWMRPMTIDEETGELVGT